jgi:hypothetical protein
LVPPSVSPLSWTPENPLVWESLEDI